MIVLMQPDASGSAKAATTGKAEKATQTGVQPVVAQAIKAGHFTAEKGKTLSLYQAAGWAAPQVIVLGMGTCSASELRDMLDKTVRITSGDKFSTNMPLAQ